MLSTVLLQISTPVPKDIPLALPLPEWLLVVLLVVSFLAHILFVNLMVGGTLLTFWYEIRGLKNKEYDTLAREIGRTITVNKSLAVVLGVAPLLSISVLYTTYFYSANSLTGVAWILVIPLVILAFLLTYLHKYTWDTLKENKLLHIFLIGLSSALFLFIPLIFLTNINLMMYPEKWAAVKGFLSTLVLPNVFPRYFHFIFASLAVTGLFIFWYNKRKNYPVEEIYQTFTRYDLKKAGYSIALGASIAQFLFGPLVLFTLPSKGLKWDVLIIIFTGVIIALPAMWWMWKALTGTKADIDKNFGKVVVAITITVIMMGSGRQLYRANALEPHQKLVAKVTADFEHRAQLAADELKNPQPVPVDNSPEDQIRRGQDVYTMNCAVCHKMNDRLVGPPLLEVVNIYKNDVSNLKKWIKQPYKKRPDYPAMIGFPQLSEAELNNLTMYLLSLTK